ncbi:MAG: hypothetical protein RL141_846 [Candidatus Parcubacteria bacterium]|jgi:ADP-ribose pyrophosphatase YjhB (NUDIX family)
MKPPQISPDFPDAFYRVTAKGMCVRDGKVLLVKDFTGRSATDPRPEWELPGGGLDFGEQFTDAIKREVREEMGLSVTQIEETPTYIWTTRHGTGRGMEWYYVLTVIFRMELEHLDFTPTEECREIRFFSKEELQQHLPTLAAQIVPLATAFDPKKFTAPMR